MEEENDVESELMYTNSINNLLHINALQCIYIVMTCAANRPAESAVMTQRSGQLNWFLFKDDSQLKRFKTETCINDHHMLALSAVDRFFFL